MDGTRIRLCLFLIGIPTLFSSPTVGASPATGTYWNADGNFALSSQTPYALRAENSSIYYAPWGTSSWGIFAFGSPTNGTRVSVDGYAFNVSRGIARSWVTENRRIVNPRSGVVGFEEGFGGSADGFSPTLIGILGRDTILAYKIRRENTSISESLSSADEDGILFDLLLVAQFPVNGSILARTLIIDFYVNQECGPLYNACSQTNDTTVNHHVVEHTHFFGWRIHENLNNGVWISDVVNLRWYLENSVHRAYCWEATGADSCNLPPVDANLYGLTATAEAFGGASGFALAYEYLLQANDCGTLQDSGHDFNHPLRMNNLSTTNIQEVDGWLGAGSLYHDTDDYYQFNVSAKWMSANPQLVVPFRGADSIWLYSHGNAPTLKSYSSNSSEPLVYNFTSIDSPGFWYVRVHRSSGFGFYAFDLWPSEHSLRPNVPPVSETCSMGSPLLPIETPPQLIIGAGIIALLVVAGGRRFSLKLPRSA